MDMIRAGETQSSRTADTAVVGISGGVVARQHADHNNRLLVRFSQMLAELSEQA